MNDDRYVFMVEWFDQLANFSREYKLSYYPVDKTFEMFDMRNHRSFLKRSEYPGVKIKDLFIGGTITIYSRQLKIMEYGDLFTKTHFENVRERTFTIIKPDVYTQTGKIWTEIRKKGFFVTRAKMGRLSLKKAQEFYSEHMEKPFFEPLTHFMSSDVCTGLELVSENAIQKWQQFIGPTNPQVARVNFPDTLRGQFGSASEKNAVHGAESASSVKKELDFFFTKVYTSAVLSNCSCLIIKPHIIKSGQEGEILDMILNEGFEISGIRMVNLERGQAEEFFDIYKGVLPEFVAMIEHMISGASLVCEIRQENPVLALKQLVGQHDPFTAKTNYPASIRYGIDKVRNAVHCTDLPEDGVLECEYFFSLLENGVSLPLKIKQQHL